MKFLARDSKFLFTGLIVIEKGQPILEISIEGILESCVVELEIVERVELNLSDTIKEVMDRFVSFIEIYISPKN